MIIGSLYFPDPERERTPVDDEGFRAWALANGFKSSDDYVLCSSHRGAIIKLAINNGVFATAWTQGETVLFLDNGPVEKVYLDEFGMMQRAGLQSMFLKWFWNDGIKPPWFNDTYAAAMKKLNDYMDEVSAKYKRASTESLQR